jgi:quercetin dioxygenase-like cupin family protein
VYQLKQIRTAHRFLNDKEDFARTMNKKIVWISLGFFALTTASLGSIAVAAGVQEKSRDASKYSYATSGVVELPNLKLLLDEATLGGKELEMAEITFPAGTVDDKHQHGSVEIFYVLSGKFGHEVNGELHWLTPGMVGVVRPGDTVRHIAPKDADVKALVIWAPAGEAKRIGITTPLRCPFPQIATYKGRGDAKRAANFECKGAQP